MKKTLNKVAYLVALATTATLAPVMSTQAAGTITFGEDRYISLGFGMRGSYSLLVPVTTLTCIAPEFPRYGRLAGSYSISNLLLSHSAFL